MLAEGLSQALQPGTGELKPATLSLEALTHTTTMGLAASRPVEQPCKTIECSVCLDNLTSPTTLELPPTTSPRERKRMTTQDHINQTDLCATSCGHLYHRLCLEFWFTQER